MKCKFKITGLGITDTAYNQLPFGRQLEFAKKIQEFKESAKTVHISQKRRSHAKAWKEFKELYQATEWFTLYEDGDRVRDDSFQIWYKCA